MRFISIASENRTDIINIFLITIIWFLIVVLVNPIGDFPLNDDWAYGWTVKTFLETGDFQLSDWTATNLLPQAIWGTIFCLPFGFSFTTLRISTLILGLVGVLTTYGLLREVKTSPSVSLLGALVIVLNPIYFVLSNSFNSDVPSFTFVVLSLYFIIRGLKLNSKVELIFGIIIAFISILNRQSSIVILPAFGLAFLSKQKLNFRTTILAFLPTISGLFLNFIYSEWLYSTKRQPLLYGLQIEQILKTFSSGLPTIASTYAKNLIIILIYLGLFLFPFLVVNFSDCFKTLPARKRQFSIFIIFFGIAIGIKFVAKGRLMPLIGNILDTFDLGPQNLNGYDSFLNIRNFVLIGISWKTLTILGVIGATILLIYFSSAVLKILSRNQKLEPEQKWLLILSFNIFLFYFLAIGALSKKYWFDRYLIFLLPILMIFISVLSIKGFHNKIDLRVLTISLVTLLFFGGFTIGATHDYLAWNRIRWQALDNLVEGSHVSPSYIDGGSEFNGWYFGNRLETCNPSYPDKSKRISADWHDFTCLWGSFGADSSKYIYTVSFVPKTGYTIDRQYTFRRWLPWREQELFVLKKLS
ncbi:MAG: glycosyltransferase family 39 protein [Gammaproteobacteria bacterium]|nr:glycosyltransferase family 39 protein [Gammaproteobacteria bacterium]